jgi:hypothetical protein
MNSARPSCNQGRKIHFTTEDTKITELESKIFKTFVSFERFVVSKIFVK